MDNERKFRKAAETIRRASKITVFTGAGLSALSGIPTYRDPGGLWKHVDPKEMATKQGFRKNPAQVWEFAQWRRKVIKECQPNQSHRILADWSKRYSQMTVITQNIDDLHQRAGTRNVLRLHGSVWDVACSLPCEDSPRRWRDTRTSFKRLPPKCHFCGALLRPGGVWFGERLPLAAAFQSAQATQCDVFISIGTSGEVYPAARLIGDAKEAGAFTIEINPDFTPATGVVSLSIHSPAEIALQNIEDVLCPSIKDS
ncbi:MAG: NAD-dependent deacylase [Planctomycetota bacterium]|nr:NAD-dependent deacylase [Planctomycetota bacterium]